MKRSKFRFGISVLFTVIAVAEISVAVVVVETITYLFQIPPDSISDRVWIWFVGILVGGVFAWVVNRVILAPVKGLSDAMDEVAKGNFDVHLSTANYIKEIRNIYEKFNLMTRELRSTEVLQSDFISSVSHEIKTPITSIEGYTMLLQNRELPEEKREMFVQKILYNTKRLSELVGNILLLSKMESQVLETKSRNFRLDEQIRQSIMLLESRWEEKTIAFDVDLDSVVYEGNESLLQHVWNNLLSNAVKFTPTGSQIRMRLVTDGAQVIFSIEDEGPGIPEELQEKIFNKFFQADSSHKQEGNGLGLALVKKILDLCGGTVAVENLPVRGCRFRVILPL